MSENVNEIIPGEIDEQRVAALLAEQPEQLLQLVHSLTDPTLPFDIERYKLAALIGDAAYKLALAREVASESAMQQPNTSEPTVDLQTSGTSKHEADFIKNSETKAEAKISDLEAVPDSEPIDSMPVEPSKEQPKINTSETPAIKTEKIFKVPMAVKHIAPKTDNDVTAPKTIAEVNPTPEVTLVKKEGLIEEVQQPAVKLAEIKATKTVETETVEENTLFAPIDLPRLVNIEMSNEDIKLVNKIATYLSGFDDRQALRTIARDVLERNRLSKVEENRLITILDAYSQAGYLRRYGKTFGYVTESERVANTESADKSIIFETDHGLEASEVGVIKYIETLTEGGKHEVHVAQIVRGYFKVQLLPPSEFRASIDMLNWYAEQGFLVHATNSPWYGLGNRRIEMPEPSTTNGPEIQVVETTPIVEPTVIETSDNTFQLPEPEQTPAEIIKEVLPATNQTSGEPEFTASKTRLSAYEAQMLRFMIKHTVPGKWFSRTSFDWESADFAMPTGTQFSTLANKLLKENTLIHNGKERGGRRLLFTEAQKPLPPKPDEFLEVISPELLEGQAIEFSLELIRVIQNTIDSARSGRVRHDTTVHMLAQKFDVSPTVSRGWVNELIAKGNFGVEKDRTSTNKKANNRYLIAGMGSIAIASPASITDIEPAQIVPTEPETLIAEPSASEVLVDSQIVSSVKAIVANPEYAGLRVAQFVTIVATKLRISEKDARELTTAMVKNGQIYRGNIGNFRTLSVEPELSEEIRTQSRQNQGKEAAVKEEHLNANQMKAAVKILDLFMKLPNPTRRLEPREVLNSFDQLGLDSAGVTEEIIKRIARVLQGQGIMNHVQAKEGVKRSRAKRGLVFKVGLSIDNNIHAVLKSPEGRGTIVKLVRSGELFVPSEE